MNLTRLAGNAPLKRQLELETARRGLSHAYILSGPAGSGKRTLAGLLAAALVCDRRGGALPCLSCAGCRKAEGGIHPDIVRVGDDGKDISVAQVRALRADAYIRPNEAERKVYILENAQTMNASAQNAMLKLLEEGPAYAAFLLLTDNAAALLPTLRSRCVHLPLSRVTQREAELWLDEHYPDQPQAARQAAADRCEGLLGRAAAELEGQAAGDTQALDGALELVRRLDGGDELALLEHCVALEKWDREQLRALLDEATDPWGIKVNRVEVKNIQPPPDIQSAMEKQMKAEREKREAVLRAEGQRQSQILVAEGEKESMILRADAAKQAAIKKAEGEAEAILKVQQATAEAIKLLNEADPKEAVLRIKALEAFQAAADGKATKIIIPSEIQGLAGLCAAAKAVFDSVEPNKPKPSAESK